MLILHQRGPVGGQPSLLKIRKHVEEMDGRDELDNRIAKKLQPLVVLHLGLCFPFPPQPEEQYNVKAGE